MRTVFLAAGAVLAGLADVPGAARAQEASPQVPAGRAATRHFAEIERIEPLLRAKAAEAPLCGS